MSKIEFFKKMLLMVGINISSIRFDTDNRCVVADYIHQGVAGQKSIPFAEIETIFSDTARTHEDTSRSSEKQPEGKNYPIF